MDERFDAKDGTPLHGYWQPPPAGPLRGAALVVHGYADHAGRYGETAAHLASLGFHALAFDYRGHGRAGGKRGHCDRFEEFLGDLECALAALRRRAGDVPVLVLAHSHGGLITLRALCDPGRPLPGVRAVVLSSPFLGLGMRVNPLKVLAGRAASRIAPRLTMPNGIDPRLLTHDAEIVARTETDALRHGDATSRWFTEATAAQEYVARTAGRIALPTLWLVGSADRIASVDAMKRVYAAAGGEKKMIVYDGFYHEVLNETGRARVLADVDEWVSPRFPAA